MFLLDFQILWVWLCSPNLRQTWIFTFIDILKTIVSPLSLTWYVIALFLSYSLDYHFYTRFGTLWCICMLCYESLMSFRLIGLSSHSCHHLLISPFVLFCYHHISILFLAFIIICFILSLLFLGLMILHILVQRGQSYHSIHPIIWHWFGDFSLRGCLMG